MKIKLAKEELIHFVGIGGIGMNGLALIMKSLGFRIQGSDLSYNKNIERLKKKKIKIIIGHNKNNIKKSTLLVISSAIRKNNPEYKEAKRKKIPIYKRGEVLGHIVSLMKNVVIAGSHGKTTTTSLTSSIFSKAKLDPTIINGGILNSLGSSAKLGKSDWCILESDESDGSFLKVPTTYSVVTNIDDEHMDYYKNIENLKNKFVKFIEKTPAFGRSFICIDDKNIKSILQNLSQKNYYSYGVDKNSNFKIQNVFQNINGSSFDIKITLPGKKIKIIKNLKIPIIGMHNIKNATAAIAVASSIGISEKIIKQGLIEFKGVQRRFNKLFTFQDSIFIDDYAHHPTEIKEVLSGVKEVYKDRKIITVFQPHRISRLRNLRGEFAAAFKCADTVVLCPIYKAGEKIKLGFSYLKFANELINKSKVRLILVNNQNQLTKYVKQNIYGKKIVIGMGAGSISNWMRDLSKLL
tara:strand:+ start:1458 stop:2852 length:1395 start_codon:yes stop_codon:yes gene_type:complete